MVKPSRKRPLTPIGSVLKALLSKLDLPEETAERGKAMLAWEKVAGEAAKHSEPAHFRGSILIISVSNHAWLHELSMRKGELLGKLEREVGVGVVTDLRFELKKNGSSPD